MIMKTLLLIGSFLICAVCFGQEKKDTRITVIPSDTADLFNRVVKTLYERDYVLDQKDKEGGLILTKDKSLNNDRTFAVKYKIRFLEGKMILTGEVWSMLADLVLNDGKQRNYSDIMFMGAKKAPMRMGWDEMLAIAKQFGTEISYSK